ncbi:MAG: oligosaccharide flippase family protein [Bacteroidales bacterium]|nr:oligosaccharide flippase family protein [Bacteroidales bacterium]
MNLIDGPNRTNKLNKQVIYSFLIKGVSIIINFILVPLVLEILDGRKYGLWVTIQSVLFWIHFFDIGVGKGLQINLGKALANEKLHQAKVIVSTAYIIIGFISILLLAILFLVYQHINWFKLFNAMDMKNVDLNLLMVIVFSTFIIILTFKLTQAVYRAIQLPSYEKAIPVLGNVMVLLIVFLFKDDLKGELIVVSAIYTISPLFIFILFSIYLFIKYPFLRPNVRLFDKKTVPSILNLGVSFFIIQIAVLVLFQSTNFIINYLYGQEEVARFDTARKLFATMYMLFSLFMTPHMSPFTYAFQKKDFVWIRKSVRKLFIFWMIIVLYGSFLLIFSDKIFNLWIGDKLSIPFNYSFYLFIFFSILTFGGIFNSFINGIGYIKLQMYSNVVSIFLFLILVYIFKYILELEAYSIILAIIFSNFYHLIIAPIQYYKIISGKAKGIWIK